MMGQVTAFKTKCKRAVQVGRRPQFGDMSDLAVVYNAPRPIYGQYEWIGDFFHGVFYMAIEPWYPEAERLDELNRQQDATVIVYVSEDKALEALKRYYDENYPDAWALVKKDGWTDKELISMYIDKTRDGDIDF